MTMPETRLAIEAVWCIESARLIAGLARIVHDEIGRDLELQQEFSEADVDTALDNDNDIDDDLLRLIFTACHPLLSTEARVALSLRLLGGLTTGEIGRAFLVPAATIAQRIVRAKRALAEAHVHFEVPRGEDRSGRLASVLEVIYLIFNEGYLATAGDDWIRPGLCEDSLRLGCILAELVPNEPEVLGLVALMELQSSRLPARVGQAGEPILLLNQNRGRWDQLLIRRGFAALERAHTPEETDWVRIAALYDAFAQLAPSPIVELNRAVAVAMAYGPAAGLDIVDQLTSEPSLQSYHLLPSVRGDLLARLGRFAEARAEFERAAALTHNTRERALLLERAQSSGQ